jgi:hypothetical protein
VFPNPAPACRPWPAAPTPGWRRTAGLLPLRPLTPEQTRWLGDRTAATFLTRAHPHRASRAGPRRGRLPADNVRGRGHVRPARCRRRRQPRGRSVWWVENRTARLRSADEPGDDYGRAAKPRGLRARPRLLQTPRLMQATCCVASISGRWQRGRGREWVRQPNPVTWVGRCDWRSAIGRAD